MSVRGQAGKGTAGKGAASDHFGSGRRPAGSTGTRRLNFLFSQTTTDLEYTTAMSVVRFALARVPDPLRPHVVRHREMVKFALVGGSCFILTLVVNYGLKLTVLSGKPTTALTIANTVATVVSYLLNRSWSFRSTVDGHRRHLEFFLFVLVSAIAIGINDIPLYISHYAFNLQTPHVGKMTAEISDFVSGLIIGTLVAMVFRFWAMKHLVFRKPRKAPEAPKPVDRVPA